MKKLLFVLCLSLITTASALERDDRYVLDGEVIRRNFVNCELFNDQPHDLEVLRYAYEISYRDFFGRLQTRNHLFQCVTGCLIESFSISRMSGPPNHPSIAQATCKALVKVKGGDDLPTEISLKRPKLFDSWE